MRSTNKGFTIVEIIITISVIAILSAMTIAAYSKVQIDARDSERASKIKIIYAALEKYYARSGEYPGCAAMTQSASLVATNVLTGIDINVLRAPMSAVGVTNAITCTSLVSGPGTDAYGYVGDVSATCSTGAACTTYTLQYRQESTNAIISLSSRH